MPMDSLDHRNLKAREQQVRTEGRREPLVSWGLFSLLDRGAPSVSAATQCSLTEGP